LDGYLNILVAVWQESKKASVVLFKSIFRKVDDGNGTLDEHEFCDALTELNCHNIQRHRKQFNEYCKDQPGEHLLDEPDFVAFALLHNLSPNSISHVIDDGGDNHRSDRVPQEIEGVLALSKGNEDGVAVKEQGKMLRRASSIQEIQMTLDNFQCYVGGLLTGGDNSRKEKVTHFFTTLEDHLQTIASLVTAANGTSANVGAQQAASFDRTSSGSMRGPRSGRQPRDIDDEFHLLKASYLGMKDEINRSLTSRHLDDKSKANLKKVVDSIEEKITAITGRLGEKGNGNSDVTIDIIDGALVAFKELHKEARKAVRKEQHSAALFLSMALSKHFDRKSRNMRSRKLV